MPEPAPAGRGLRCKLGHGLGSKISAPEYGTGSSSRGLAHHISFLRFVVENDRTVIVGEVPLPCYRCNVGHACFGFRMDSELFTVCYDCLGHDIILGAWLTGLQIGLKLLLSGLVPEAVRA